MTKIINQAVFLRLSLFYIAGIIVQVHWDLYPLWIYTGIFSLPVIAVSFFPAVVRLYHWRWLFGFGLFLLCFSSAGILSRNQWKASEWQGDTDKNIYRVQILDEPVKKPKTLMFRVGVEGQKALIYIPIDSLSMALSPSDWLVTDARFEKTEQMFLRKGGIAARAFAGKNHWKKLDNYGKQRFNLRFEALKRRRILLNRLREIIPGEKSFAVGAALLLGYTRDLDKDIRQTFVATGASHILSISGLHFSIIYGILYFLFSFLGNHKKGRILRQAIILPLLWFFVFLTGMGPSVIRAAVMISLWGVGNAFLYKPFTINTVGAAAFFMLLYNPFNLYDVGFQLSFSAVMSIILINKHLVKLYESRNPMIQYIWELSCVSTSAQLGTAPLSMYYFHQFPLLFLVTNIFAIPMTAIILCLIPLSLLLQCFPVNNWGLMWPVNQSLTWFILGLEKIEEIPNQLINSIFLNKLDVICITCYVILFFLLMIKKRIYYLYLLLICGLFQVIYYLCEL
ncbi:MAG: ComEC/Rec2 family competence protein [Dysgonamonadaceae bacterium]|jgi:competence protein ComEC|nr:ComEC/Rec2 family competence protein [Dysgonamonadaceae bacterium]